MLTIRETHPLRSWFREPKFQMIDYFGLHSDLVFTISEWTTKSPSWIDCVMKKRSLTEQKYDRLTAGSREWISDPLHTPEGAI